MTTGPTDDLDLPPIAPSIAVRPNPRCTYRRFADGSGAVLLHLDTAAYHGLNPIGSAIWDAIGDGTTFGELMAELRTKIEDPPETLDAEISAFLRDLEERDLLSMGADLGPHDASTEPPSP